MIKIELSRIKRGCGFTEIEQEINPQIPFLWTTKFLNCSKVYSGIMVRKFKMLRYMWQDYNNY